MPTTTHTDPYLEADSSVETHDLAPDQSLAVESEPTSQEEKCAENVDAKAKPNKKHTLRLATKQLVAKLYESYPSIFPRPGTGKPVVLAIGLHKELQPIIKEWGFDNIVLRSALSWYTRQLRYQRAVLESTHRTSLNGSQAEEISDEQKKLAQQKIDETTAWLSEHHPEKLQAKPAKKTFVPRKKREENGAGVVLSEDNKTETKPNSEIERVERSTPAQNKARSDNNMQPAFKRKSKPNRPMPNTFASKKPRQNEKSVAAEEDKSGKNLDAKLLDLLTKFNNK